MKEKTKIVLKRILGSILFLAILLGVLSYAAFVTKRKNSDEKYADFFNQEQDFDVLFFGSSRVLNGVYPMELWDDHGMVSYNFGGHGNYIPVSYWVWRNTMNYTKPKLVVIDTYYIEENNPYRENTQQVHLSTDAFPLSKTKYEMVQDLFGDEKSDFHKNRNEFLFNFGSYHDRWSDLTKDDFVINATPEKGAEMRIDVADELETHWYREHEIPNLVGWTGDSLGKLYLKQWIKDCQDQGIEVLLIYLPHVASYEQQDVAIGTKQLAEEMGVNYLNLLYEDIVDHVVDYYDQDGHLNPLGARKVTDYLGEYIEENYDIPNRKRDENYSRWWDDYQRYTEYKVDLLKSQKYLETYLLMCADSDFDVTVEVNSKSQLLEDRKIDHLLWAIGHCDEVKNNANVVEEINDDSWYYDIHIVVKYAGTDEVIDDARFTIDDGVKPSDEALDNAIFYANEDYIRIDY